MNVINYKFIIIQAIGFIGTLIYFLSYQFKDNKKLFKVQLVSYIFYITHLFLLNASTGAISYIVNLIRSYCLSSNNEKLHSNKVGVILCVVQIFVGVYTWSNWLSILPVVANIASTIAGYSHSAKSVRMAGLLINSPLWIIYDAFVGSWAGVIDELICDVSMIISIVRYGFNNLDKKEG